MLERGGKCFKSWGFFGFVFLKYALEVEGKGCKIVPLFPGQTNIIIQNASMRKKIFYLLEVVFSAHQNLHFLLVVLFEHISCILCLFCPKWNKIHVCFFKPNLESTIVLSPLS